MIKRFNDAERIQRNYCRQYIRQILIYRFSMKELRRIARAQGMQYKRRTAKYDRHVDEFTWFEDKIYEAMGEIMRSVMVKLERQLFEPYNSVQIDDIDLHYFNIEFEKLLYDIVK